MAIMRCKRHTPKGRTHVYVNAIEPVGYPTTALICGSVDCREPAFIWLERDEQTAYLAASAYPKPSRDNEGSRDLTRVDKGPIGKIYLRRTQSLRSLSRYGGPWWGLRRGSKLESR